MNMKVLLINGSPNKTGCTYTALSEVEKVLNANNQYFGKFLPIN